MPFGSTTNSLFNPCVSETSSGSIHLKLNTDTFPVGPGALTLCGKRSRVWQSVGRVAAAAAQPEQVPRKKVDQTTETRRVEIISAALRSLHRLPVCDSTLKCELWVGNRLRGLKAKAHFWSAAPQRAESKVRTNDGDAAISFYVSHIWSKHPQIERLLQLSRIRDETSPSHSSSLRLTCGRCDMLYCLSLFRQLFSIFYFMPLMQILFECLPLYYLVCIFSKPFLGCVRPREFIWAAVMFKTGFINNFVLFNDPSFNAVALSGFHFMAAYLHLNLESVLSAPSHHF